MNRAEQALHGLTLQRADGIVLVNDGEDHWLCRERAWADALKVLEGKPAFESDDGNADAYDELCHLIDGPVASVIGSSTGAWRALVFDAFASDLIDSLKPYGL